MKKIIATGATLLMALMVAAPSFAAMETKVTGTFTLDGVLNMNPDLVADDDAKETKSFREMQLRINTETKVTDKITFFTRADILDKVLSSQHSNSINESSEDDDNIQIDHAWMRIISPIGVWQLGRKTGIKWGTDFFDDGNAYGTDRAEYILPIPVGDDKFVFGAVAEKALETKQTNRDNDKFYLTGTYVNKDWKTGILGGLYSYNSFIEGNAIDQTILNNVYNTGATVQSITTAGAALVTAATPYSAAATAFSGVASTFFPRVDGQVFYIAPYFSGKVGPLNINAEFGFITGEAVLKADDFLEATRVIDATNAHLNSLLGTTYSTTNEAAARANLGKLDKDANAMCYWLEAGLPMGSANVELGYAFMSGDKDGFSGDLEAAGLLGQGEDWEKFLILFGDNTGLDTTLDGNGNILTPNTYMNTAGISLMYVGGGYNITDSTSISGLFGMAKADEARAGWDDDYGMEVDLTLSCKLMDNLDYKATAAYLMAGDFWKGGVAGAKIDDMSAFYHELVLSF